MHDTGEGAAAWGEIWADDLSEYTDGGRKNCRGEDEEIDQIHVLIRVSRSLSQAVLGEGGKTTGKQTNAGDEIY